MTNVTPAGLRPTAAVIAARLSGPSCRNLIEHQAPIQGARRALVPLQPHRPPSFFYFVKYQAEGRGRRQAPRAHLFQSLLGRGDQRRLEPGDAAYARPPVRLAPRPTVTCVVRSCARRSDSPAAEADAKVRRTTSKKIAQPQMTAKFKSVFGPKKPVIAMVHLGALPGSPLHDAESGLDGLVEGARKDLHALQEAGFDAVMFGNENDRPYEFEVDTASTATMAYVIGRLRSEITVPFGVNVLWDPMSTMALAAATGASFVREIFTGTYASDMGPWTPDAGKALRYRDRLGRSRPRRALQRLGRVRLFARPAEPADRARSAVFSSIPDAILVSGAITGEAAAMSDLEAVKKALPEHAGARQYRRQARDGRRCAESRRRLHRRLVAEGRRQHLERRSTRSARPSSCGSSAAREGLSLSDGAVGEARATPAQGPAARR